MKRGAKFMLDKVSATGKACNSGEHGRLVTASTLAVRCFYLLQRMSLSKLNFELTRETAGDIMELLLSTGLQLYRKNNCRARKTDICAIRYSANFKEGSCSCKKKTLCLPSSTLFFTEGPWRRHIGHGMKQEE